MRSQIGFGEGVLLNRNGIAAERGHSQVEILSAALQVSELGRPRHDVGELTPPNLVAAVEAAIQVVDGVGRNPLTRVVLDRGGSGRQRGRRTRRIGRRGVTGRHGEYERQSEQET